MTELVRAAILSDFRVVAVEAGLNAHAELARAGIDSSVLTEPQLLVAVDRIATLLEGAAERSKLPDFAIRLAMRRRVAHLGVSGLVLSQQPTIREALAMASRYRHLITEAVSVFIEEGREISVARVELTLGRRVPARQGRELAVAAYVHLFRLLIGEEWRPQVVHFVHPAPRGRTLHERYFGVKVQYDALFNGFAFATSELDRLNDRADAALAEYAEGLLDLLPGAQKQSPADVVRRLTIALLPMGRASIANVAKTMNKNVRTLQREIEEAGTSFRDILNESREDLCLNYLRHSSLNIQRIAEQLGYGSPSAFIRWFKSRYGVSPQAWRDREAKRAARAVPHRAGGGGLFSAKSTMKRKSSRPDAARR